MLELHVAGESVMSHRQYVESGNGGEDKDGNNMKANTYNESWNQSHDNRDSSEDPDIKCTHTDRHLSSNVRNHPKAELKSRNSKTRHSVSNHAYNHVTNESGAVKSCDPESSNGKRRRSLDKEDVWTEHTSSTGRTYYYNKHLDKSQWEAPNNVDINRQQQSSSKKARTDSTPSTGGGGAKKDSTPSMGGGGAKKDSTPSGARGAKKYSTSSSARGGGARIDSTPSSARGGGARIDSTPSSARGGARIDSTPSGGKSSVSPMLSKSSRHEGRRESGSDHSRSSGYRDRGSDHTLKEGGGVRDTSRHGSHGDWIKQRDRHPRSHSRSSSPGGGGGGKRGESHTSKINHSRTSSGRGHTGHGSSSDKATPSRPNRSNVHNHTSPSCGSTPKANAVQLISPTTPGGGGGASIPFPANLSHTLTTTQQLIDHNSILIEQRQKLLARGEATPTPGLTTPTGMPTSSVSGGQVHSHVISTPPSHHQPMVKKKLSHTLLQMGSQTYPSIHYVGGVMYTSHDGVTLTPATSPQISVDSSGLHPLQKALLIQNQQMQQIAYTSGVEPNIQTTPTGIPHHMTSFHSHPGSPILQSPTSIPRGLGTPNYSIPPGPIQPLTPLHTNIYPVPLVTSHDFETPPIATPIHPQFSVLSSIALQKPMSRLGYINTSELFQFPDSDKLEKIRESQVNVELVDRELATFWLLHDELLSKQVDQYQLDILRKKVVQRSFLCGQLVKKSLMLEGSQFKTASRYTRFAQLQKIIQDIDKR